jgi:L-asparaginase / beta-aspartyl-peptidase
MSKEETKVSETASRDSGGQVATATRAVLVIHGGAGVLTRERYPTALQAQYHAALKAALHAGHAVLASGGCALDAVEAAILVMEDSPLFNAGKGAVLTKEGRAELDASIMVSHPLAAGVSGRNADVTRRTTAVTMISHVKNPITLAKRLYLAQDETPHVFHCAPHAEKLAARLGCEIVEESYFHTPERDDQFLSGNTGDHAGIANDMYDAKGTVGAVALDVNGCLAVGTSTGGKGGKLPGRIGDTPVPGAGYWSDQFIVQRRTGLAKVFTFMKAKEKLVGMAVSGTGDGDYFLRYAVAHDIFARMKYKGQGLEQATKDVLGELGEYGGQGGVIGLTLDGEIIMGMNCVGMFRGWIDLTEGIPRVGIFADDHVHW